MDVFVSNPVVKSFVAGSFSGIFSTVKKATFLPKIFLRVFCTWQNLSSQQKHILFTVKEPGWFEFHTLTIFCPQKNNVFRVFSTNVWNPCTLVQIGIKTTDCPHTIQNSKNMIELVSRKCLDSHVLLALAL